MQLLSQKFYFAEISLEEVEQFAQKRNAEGFKKRIIDTLLHGDQL